MVGD
jgi:hypothetical protein